MKLFHLSDLHIGLKLMNRDLREDQEYIFRQIVSLAAEEQPDCVLIAGDIYHKAVPSAEAVEVFDLFSRELAQALPAAQIMMISGNHDSAPRVNCFRSLLSRQGVHMIGLPPQTEGEKMAKVRLFDQFGPVNFYLLPFVRPSMVRQVVGTEENGNSLSYDETLRRMIEREEIDRGERNVLVSHQFYLPAGKRAEEVERTDGEIRTVGNIDQVSASVLEPFDYAALGHIHKPMTVGKQEFRYCGSPLATSVSEAGQQKGILAVELLEKGRAEIRTLPLKPMRQVRLIEGSLEEVLAQSCSDYVTVVLTQKKAGTGALGTGEESLEEGEAQERIRRAFPYLLEIRRKQPARADWVLPEYADRGMDAFELCCSFLNNADQEDQELLKEVIHQIQEVQ